MQTNMQEVTSPGTPAVRPAYSPLLNTAERSNSHTMDKKPPALPPPRQRSKTHSWEGPSRASRYTPLDNSRQSSNRYVMSLATFAREHSGSLPIQIECHAGYTDVSDTTQISNGDVLNIHLMKKVDFIRAKSLYSKPFNIPLNSAVRFSLLHDPNGNMEEANQGFTYKKVSDLTALATLPKVVCVTNAWKRKDEENFLMIGEVLVVRKVLSKKRGLKVFSVSFNLKKRLPLECEGGFSTSPYDIPLHLLEITSHIPKPFPCRVRLSARDSVDMSHLMGGVLMLLEQRVEPVLVATNVKDETDTIIELPVSLPGVEVSITRMKVKRRNSLLFQQMADQFGGNSKIRCQSNTGQVANQIDYSRIDIKSRQVVIQSRFADSQINAEHMTDEDNIVDHFGQPKNTRSKQLLALQTVDEDLAKFSRLELVASDSGDDTYEPIEQYVLMSPVHAVRSVHQSSCVPKPSDVRKVEESSYAPALKESSSATKASEANKVSYAPYKIALKEFDQSSSANNASDARKTYLQYSSTVSSVQSMPSSIVQGASSTPEPSGDSRHLLSGPPQADIGPTVEDTHSSISRDSQQNEAMAKLRSFSVEEVGALLEAKGLQQYRMVFEKEHIDGEILCELDNEILEKELGITLKLHRIRIMKLIPSLSCS